MAESISRTEWLRLELDAADDYIARHAADPDPIAHFQVLRRRREAAAFRAELAVRDAAAAGTLIGAYVRIRHHGPHGVTVIESFVTDVDVNGGVEVDSHPSHSFPMDEVVLLEDGPVLDIPAGRGPAIDYGTVWTDPAHPDDHWIVSWHPDTGDLTAHNRRSGALRALATFPTRDDVERALAGWAQLAQQPDGLAQLTARLTRPQPAADIDACYGLVVDVDGTITRLSQPARHVVIRRALPDIDDLDVVTLPGHGLVMFVDDHGHARQRPPNPTATALYGTGWPIVGPVVLAADEPNEALPDTVVRFIEILADTHARTPAPARDPGPSSVQGVVVRANGRRIMIQHDVSADIIRDVLRSRPTHTEAAAWPHAPDDLRMIVTEQRGDLPANHYAARIHNSHRPIRGDIIVCRRGGGRLPTHLVRDLCGDLDQASRTMPLRTVETLRGDLAGTRQLQASHRSRPDLAGDPLADQMRHDNERDIVRLVAELDRRVVPPAHPAPAPPLPKPQRRIIPPTHPPPSPPSAGLV